MAKPHISRRAAARYAALALAATWVSLGSGSRDAAAQRVEEADGRPVACISLSRVERTSVVDEDTILFYLSGGEVYRNDLPHRCPTLKSEDTFMYRVTTSQLCSVDVITVLEHMGSRFMPGASCGLGGFMPISAEDAQALEHAPERAAGRSEGDSR
jgi:hypothetical protein